LPQRSGKLFAMAPLPRFAELDQRVALVTGGTSGIGQATVAAMTRQGMFVAFTHLPSETPPSHDPSCQSLHPLDLRSVESIAACVEAAIERWGRLDVLVNNAGVGSATVAAFGSDEDLQDEAMLSINALGVMRMCHAAIRRATGPLKIVNVSSVGGGISQFPGFRLSDGMSKAAVAHLTRQLAAEHVHDNVDVFAICPGATETPMFHASTLAAMTEVERSEFTAALPKARLIQPDDIAAVITWLATDHSAVMHGAVIDTSMGLGVRPGLMTERPH
jgi:NAD(P)-dependent dehydrogenase (short-subunit alcohol dehydrogenase family)